MRLPLLSSRNRQARRPRRVRTLIDRELAKGKASEPTTARVLGPRKKVLREKIIDKIGIVEGPGQRATMEDSAHLRGCDSRTSKAGSGHFGTRLFHKPKKTRIVSDTGSPYRVDFRIVGRPPPADGKTDRLTAKKPLRSAGRFFICFTIDRRLSPRQDHGWEEFLTTPVRRSQPVFENASMISVTREIADPGFEPSKAREAVT